MKLKTYFYILLILAITLNIYLASQFGNINRSYTDTLIQVSNLRTQVEKYTADVNATLDEYDKAITDIEQRAIMAVESVDSLHEYMVGRSIEIGRGWWVDYPETVKGE